MARKSRRTWRPTTKQVVWASIFGAALTVAAILAFRLGLNRGDRLGYVPIFGVGALILVYVGYRYEWTGFGETSQPKSDNREILPKKTLWDWMGLLVVPLALAGIGLWFTAQQNAYQQRIEDDRRERELRIEEQRSEREQELENQRAEAERKIEEQRAQDAALQSYLDQMTTLLLDANLRGSDEDSEARTLARARTITILGRLDSSRKAQVMRFLVEANLVGRIDGRAPIVELSDLDLSMLRIDLSDANLAGNDLSGSNLARNNLSGANLNGTDLSKADLTGAFLSEAEMNGANLSFTNTGEEPDEREVGGGNSGATLAGAYLVRAELKDANLWDANLSHVYASDADLSNALLTEANLNAASLSSANLRAANLNGAILSDADLTEVNLTDADLIGASIRGANLLGADLSGADLSEAELSNKQVEACKSLEDATMPNGEKYESWINGT